MSNIIETNEICYEQPLNERMRTFLRYEQLNHQFSFFAKQENSSDSHAALLTLIEILSLVSRGDLKQELLKEIKRQIDTLEQLSNKPKLNTNKLTQILSKHKNTFDRLHTVRGQIGNHLKENDFINSCIKEISKFISIKSCTIRNTKRLTNFNRSLIHDYFDFEAGLLNL